MSYISIENEQLHAQIRLFGAELASLKKKSNQTEYIWQADPAIWKGSAPVLFPFVGQLNQGKYRYQGHTYAIAKHGFARNQPFTLISQTANQVTLALTQNPETQTCYPFDFCLHVTFELTENKLQVSYQVTNNSNVDMPFGIGSHPAFNLHADDMDTALCSLHLSADEGEFCHTLDKGLLSTETQLSPIIAQQLKLNAHTFKNDAPLILRNIETKAVSLKDKNNQTLLTMRFDVPHLGIWAKENAPYVCIEPWFSTDDNKTAPIDLEDKSDLLILKSQQQFNSQYEIEIN